MCLQPSTAASPSHHASNSEGAASTRRGTSVLCSTCARTDTKSLLQIYKETHGGVLGRAIAELGSKPERSDTNARKGKAPLLTRPHRISYDNGHDEAPLDPCSWPAASAKKQCRKKQHKQQHGVPEKLHRGDYRPSGIPAPRPSMPPLRRRTYKNPKLVPMTLASTSALPSIAGSRSTSPEGAGVLMVASALPRIEGQHSRASRTSSPTMPSTLRACMEDRGSVTPIKKELQLGTNARARRTLQMVGRWDVSAEDARELMDTVERQQSAHTHAAFLD